MKTKVTSIIMGIMLMAAITAKAQSPFLNTSGNSFATLEFGKPIFDNSDTRKGISTFTSVTYLNGKYAIDDHFKIVAELPLSAYGYDRAGVKNDNHLALGNIYVGAEYHGVFANTPLRGYIEAGLRPSTVSKLKSPDKLGAWTGLTTDSDRNDAFMEHYMTAQTIGNLFYKVDDNVTLRLRAGPSMLISTSKNAEMDNQELFLIYSPQVWFNVDQLNIGAGMTGRWLTTENGNFNENSVHQVSTYVSYQFNQLVPGIFVRVPTDKDYSKMVDLVYGITLGVDLSPRR